MNRFVLHFAGGGSFFVGLSLVVATIALALVTRNRILRRILSVLRTIGVLGVLLSATPQPWWMYAAWLLTLAATIFTITRKRAPRVMALALPSVFTVASVIFCFVEIPYHLARQVRVPEGIPVYVVGDSLSSGLGQVGEMETNWPTVLNNSSGLEITNLARAGATTKAALRQVAAIPAGECVVLVEIGGNDIMNGTRPGEFRECLDQLLAAIDHDTRSVVMFELPLPPSFNGFGQAQRELADQYGVILLPKRHMAKILGMKDATLDGGHLSQEGHNAMAELVGSVIVAVEPQE